MLGRNKAAKEPQCSMGMSADQRSKVAVLSRQKRHLYWIENVPKWTKNHTNKYTQSLCCNAYEQICTK